MDAQHESALVYKNIMDAGFFYGIFRYLIYFMNNND